MPGHIGLWAGLYVIGAHVCFWQLAGAGPSGSWPPVLAIIAVAMAATAVYAIDRVKLHDKLIDPADLQAQPVRYAFLTRHSMSVRVLAFALLISAMLLAMQASHYLPIVIGLSLVGVVVYAPGPRKSLPRPKDLLGLKNLWVALGVVALTIVATALVGPLSKVEGEAFWTTARLRIIPILDAATLLLIRVIIDAAICDIDDSESDRTHGTRTLANTIGRRNTLWIAIAAKVLLAGLIVAVARSPASVRVAWAVVTVAFALLLIPMGKRSLRDWTDVSFVIEAMLVTVLMAIYQRF